jgi:ADP-heptose:LPS heptosyltransferase
MLKLIFTRIAHYISVILVDGLMIHFVRSPQNKKGLLLIRLDAIGDFFLWIDCAEAYRRLYPDHHITLLGNNIWTPIAKQFPYWDDVWEINLQKLYSHPIYRLKTLSKVRRAGFQIAIQAVVSRRLSIEDAVIVASKSRQKIGATGDATNISPTKMRVGNKFYTKLVQVSVRDATIPQSNSDFVHGLGIKDIPVSKTSLLLMKNNSTSKTSIGHELKDFYILFPGAGSAYRRWPASRFAELSCLIYQHYGIVGIIEGDKGEKSLGRAILKASGNHHLIDMTGRSSVLDLTETIKRAKFVVGNESSGIHIAAYMNTPSICILGGGYFGKFIPYDSQFSPHRLPPIPVYQYLNCFNCNWKRPCMPFFKRLKIVPCIDAIRVDQVWDELQNLMNQKEK